jgi:MFS family permease
MQINVILLGASNIIWVPLGNCYGRRPVLVIATLIMTMGSLWCGLATSFDSLMAARAIQGLGGGPADTLAPDILGEIFFVHERGRAMVEFSRPPLMSPPWADF